MTKTKNEILYDVLTWLVNTSMIQFNKGDYYGRQ